MNIDYYKIIKEKAIIIWYRQGMRGNSIYRILAAHPEVYWNPTLQQSSREVLQHPLDLPETVSGFNAPNVLIGKNGFIKDTPYLQVAYSTYHTAGYIWSEHFTNSTMKESASYRIVKQWLMSRSYLDKKLFVMTHPDNEYETYRGNDPLKSLLTLDDKPHIWIYGSINRLALEKYYINPSPNPLAYNLNLDALYSTDYSTFETEYYKLINHFNLTSCINRVRAFILLNLERDNYISKFY